LSTPSAAGSRSRRSISLATDDGNIIRQRHRWSFASQIGFGGAFVELNEIQVDQGHCASKVNKGAMVGV